MSLDKNDISNKMMTTPPAKKEFHFAATAEHYAEVVYAETIEKAEAIYHKIKRHLGSGASVAPAVPDLPAQSTAPKEPEPEGIN